MRFHSLFGTLVFGNFLFFIFATPALAEPQNILLSEISTAGEKSNDEFIELFNPSDTTVDISNMQLRRRTASGSESSLRVFPNNTSIPAHGYFLWAHSDGIYAAPFADSETSSSALADNNGVALYTRSGPDGILLDSIAWGTGSRFVPETPAFPNPGKKKGLSRNATTLEWALVETLTPTNRSGNVFPSEPVTPPPDPTPDPTPQPAPSSEKVSISINEILSNPIGNETEGEFIELYNESKDAVSLDGFTLRDASKSGLYTFPTGTTISGKEYLLLRRSISKLSLNNTNETLSLFDISGTLIDSARYEKSKEGVSQNRVGNTLRGGTPTPGQPNQLNTLPETKERVPKKGYRGIAVAFDAHGKDADGGKLKYTWDFGDDHKSYKEKTTHKYTENGTYIVTLTTTDGSDDVTETFPIKIESFPKPEVRITALAPNPSGRDSDAEWLLIENRDKKVVDLKGYGIATGWKKLVNHPVRESLVIAPKSEAKLTREFSLFTLPNQKGKIELRAPDGTVLQDITYKLEKSATEDAVYFKEKGRRWAWKEETEKTVLTRKTPTNQNTDELPEQTEDTETTQEDSIDITIPAEVEASTNPEQTLGVTAEVATDQKYLKLLNYGTEVNIPENIVLSFPESDIDKLLPKRDHYAITFAKGLIGTINTALNAAQNKAWSGQAL